MVQALIAAEKAGITLAGSRFAIDLATKGIGKTVVEAVHTWSSEIDDPLIHERSRITIDGITKDGIEVKVKARVTVGRSRSIDRRGDRRDDRGSRGRRHCERIGSAETYKAVLEVLTVFRKRCLPSLDCDTAFEILSIDIADIDVGDNIGARLQAEQAEADKSVARAQAEIRRAAAMAVAQEMRATSQEMRAKVVEAEAQVPHRDGRGISCRTSRNSGLLPDEKCPSRYFHARIHCRRRQAADGWDVIRLRVKALKRFCHSERSEESRWLILGAGLLQPNSPRDVSLRST